MNEKYISAPDPFELKAVVARREGWKPAGPIKVVPRWKRLQYVGLLPDELLPRYMQLVRRETA